MVDKNRVLQIGNPGNAEVFGRVGRMYSLFRQLNMNEFDVVVWAMGVSFVLDTLEVIHIDLRAPIGKDPFAKFQKLYQSFVGELLGWVARGGILVVFPARVRAFTDGQYIDVTDEFPANLVQTKLLSGELVEVANPEFGWLKHYCPILRYGEVLAGANLIPMFVSSNSRPGATQVVGGYIRHGEGLIVIPPAFSRWDALPLFIDDLAELPKRVRRVAAEVPEWTSQFISAHEAKAIEYATDLGSRMENLAAEISEQKLVLSAERNLKHLFASSGDEFQDSVKLALEEFGLKVVEGPHPRADLLISDGRRLAAAEVKGLDGPVREANHRQAVRWMSEANAALAAGPEERKDDPELENYAVALTNLGIDVSKPRPDVECRGVMVIGTYRTTPLNRRPAENFPDPVKRGIERTPVCALTGPQLYCLLQQFRTGDIKRESVVDALFETSGPLSGGSDWKSVLKNA